MKNGMKDFMSCPKNMWYSPTNLRPKKETRLCVFEITEKSLSFHVLKVDIIKEVQTAGWMFA